MPPEIASSARPTLLRLTGFLCLAAGALLAGAGAMGTWAVSGFPLDTEGALDVTWSGVDVWEGKVVLLLALASLPVLVGLRVARSNATRRALAVSVIVAGVACAALPIADAARATDRFGDVDRIITENAARAGLTEEIVREQLAELLEDSLRVETGFAIWMAAAGGILMAVGGVLAIVWVRRRAPESEGSDPIP